MTPGLREHREPLLLLCETERRSADRRWEASILHQLASVHMPLGLILCILAVLILSVWVLRLRESYAEAAFAAEEAITIYQDVFFFFFLCGLDQALQNSLLSLVKELKDRHSEVGALSAYRNAEFAPGLWGLYRPLLFVSGPGHELHHSSCHCQE